jgi:hypothetical protein
MLQTKAAAMDHSVESVEEPEAASDGSLGVLADARDQE